jgi:5-formyltetrahydrofolate cyclo-ligase
MTGKTEIRKAIRILRNNLSQEYKELAAKQCYNTIIKHNIIHNNHAIAFYLTHDSELNLKYILQYCLQIGIKCYLPVIDDINKNLKFVEFDNTSTLINNKYHIPEPLAKGNFSYIDPKNLDTVFLPLVAFTSNGQRLGMGGGYYDRTFAFLANTTNSINTRKPKLIGIAYDAQCVTTLPKESWDINLHGVATESTFLTFK